MEHVTAGNQRAAGRHSESEFEKCAELCFECYRVCSKAVSYCLEKGGRHAEADHIRLLTDCARICEASGDFLTRGSVHHHHTCQACAAVCDDCAAHCAAMGDDPVMARCADVCKRCAESCRMMSTH